MIKINLQKLKIGKVTSEKWQLPGNSYIDIIYLLKEKVNEKNSLNSKELSTLSYETHLTNTTSSNNYSHNIFNNIDKNEEKNKNIYVPKLNAKSNDDLKLCFKNELKFNSQNNANIYKNREPLTKKNIYFVSKISNEIKNYISKNNNNNIKNDNTENLQKRNSLKEVLNYKITNNDNNNTDIKQNINNTDNLISEEFFKKSKMSFSPKKLTYKDDFHGYESDFESVTLRCINAENNHQENIEKNMELDNIHSLDGHKLKKQKSLKDTKHKKLSEILNEENKKEKIEILEYKFIKKDTNINEINDISNFCIGVFVTGIFPFQQNLDTSIFINEQNNYIAPCGHRTCSLIFSMVPKIINFYVKDNLQKYIDLKDQIAELSFPLGIKLCIEGNFDNIFNPQNSFQRPQQIFYNILQKNDDIYYTTTIQYFIEMKILDFKEKYKIDPISIFIQQTKNNKDFKRTMNLLGNLLLNNDSIYLPESITLVSKHPFYIPMNMCLNCLIALNNIEANNLINHIINEVPTPNKNTQIIFYLPNEINRIILNHELNNYKYLALLDKENDDNDIYLLKNSNLSLSQINSKILLDLLSIDNIIIIFQLILLEQKILFVNNNYQILSQIILIFNKLIYPFTYKFTLKPIITRSNIEEYFTKQNQSFIIGIDEYLLLTVLKKKSINHDVIIFSIKENIFISSKTKKKISKKDLIHEYKLSLIPDKICETIIISLKNIQQNIKKLISENKQNNSFGQSLINIDTKINIEFLKFMILLIGDYNAYTFYFEEEIPIFNRDAFIESHKDKEYRNFLSHLTKTKLFADFLLDCKKIYFSKKKNKLKNNLMKILYFIKNIGKYPELLNNKQLQIFYLENKNYMLKNLEKVKKENEENKEKSAVNNIDKNINDLTYEKKNKRYKSIGKLLSNKKYEDISKNNENNEEEEQSNVNNINIINMKRKKVSFKANKNFFEDEIDNENLKYRKESENDCIKKNLYFTNYLTLPKRSMKRKYSIGQNNNYNNLNFNFNKKNKNQIQKYLLFPYFLKLDEDGENYIQSEKYIKKEIMLLNEKKKIKIFSYDEPQIFIISKKIDYNFDLIKKNKIYLLPKNNQKKLLTHRTDKLLNYKKNLLINKINNENSFSHINYDDFRQVNKSINSQETSFISNCFKLCFSNKSHISSDQYKYLKKILLKPDNTDFFANLILSDIYLSYYQKKQLTSNGFNEIYKMIKISLKNLTNKENNTGRLLTYACFIYYKIEKEKNIYYIFQELLSGKNNIAEYKIWNTEDFWVEFFCSEYEKNNIAEKSDSDDEDDSSSKDEKNFVLDETSILKNAVVKVSNIMINLGIKMEFIQNLFEKIILPIYEREQAKINKLMNTVFSGKYNEGEK